MADIEKTKKGLECCIQMGEKRACSPECPYETIEPDCWIVMNKDALELLKKQQEISVDAFLQWCIESHRIGDATRTGIEYWVNEFKAWKQKAKDGEREALCIKQEQVQGESEPIAKCRDHLSCSFCKHDWWSEEAFPKKCPKCRTEFMK